MEGQVMLLEDGSPLHLIHFTYACPAGTSEAKGLPLTPAPRDTYKVACVPNLMESRPDLTRPCPLRRSDDPRAVNCPACKATQVFQDAAAYQNAVLGSGRRIT